MGKGQNGDWHADTGVHMALFWEHIEFQNRAIALWEALAKRYKGNTWVRTCRSKFLGCSLIWTSLRRSQASVGFPGSFILG